MKRSSGPRKIANLSESIHLQINMYALAASTAGVSLLAAAQPSEAKIVYTPAHVVIDPHHRYDLELNNNGVVDVVLIDSRRMGSCQTSRHGGPNFTDFLIAQPTGGNAVEGNNGSAFALSKGAPIGRSQSFIGFPGGGMGTHVYGYFYNPRRGCQYKNLYYGEWPNVTDRYLGLKFVIHGKTHYGWARLNVQIVKRKGIVGTLTGYAYETIVGRSIIAGKTTGVDEAGEEDFSPDASLTSPIPNDSQPASLGILALGAPAIPLWPRKESVVAAPESY